MRGRLWLLIGVGLVAVASGLLAVAGSLPGEPRSHTRPVALLSTDGEATSESPPLIDPWALPWNERPGRAEGQDRGQGPGERTGEHLTEVQRLADRAAAARQQRREALAAELDERSISAEGFEVAGGSSEAGSGSRVTFTIEVEPGAADLGEATEIIEDALYDDRSWANDHTLVRHDDPETADVRVVVASPDTVDELCAEAGLDTGGRYSCWNGTFAALNAWRWENGADAFDDMTTYHRYLVNHEFGHGLGYGHVDCPEPGALAPVMMQQTISVDACEPNGWPYPADE